MKLSGLGASCYTSDQLYQIALGAGFPSDAAQTMAAIAMGESSGCPTAYNPGRPLGAENSIGLWQINTKGNPTILTQLGLSDTSQLYDPATNARAAYLLWSTNGFAPWSVYNSGAYMAYLQVPSVDPVTGLLTTGDQPYNPDLASVTDPTTLLLAGGAALLVLYLIT